MKATSALLIAIVLAAQRAGADDHRESAPSSKTPPAQEHESMAMADGADDGESMAMNGLLGAYPMTREASGTSWEPESSPMEGIHLMAGDWMMMFHGYVQGIYDHQGGRRGDDDWFGNSMAMAMAQHALEGGTFGVRTMISLDPAMIGNGGYPNLLQTGETADGRTPLIDRQHPHDLFMELAATYSHPTAPHQSAFLYFGYPGEPALGPVTFMHRLSGMEMPEAPITHHWLDSTHISFGVATVGYIWKDVKIEASSFTGREPDQERWDFDSPRFDSYSARISYNPIADLALQVSYGHLVSPEQLEPAVDQDRWTASATYNAIFDENNWSTTFAWGQDNNLPGNRLNGFLLETTLAWMHRHTFMLRAERVSKDELFDAGEPLAGSVFTVNKISAGYIFDLPAWGAAQLGIGALGTVAILPDELHPSYGADPWSYLIFVRLKLVSPRAM